LKKVSLDIRAADGACVVVAAPFPIAVDAELVTTRGLQHVLDVHANGALVEDIREADMSEVHLAPNADAVVRFLVVHRESALADLVVLAKRHNADARVLAKVSAFRVRDANAFANANALTFILFVVARAFTVIKTTAFVLEALTVITCLDAFARARLVVMRGNLTEKYKTRIHFQNT